MFSYEWTAPDKYNQRINFFLERDQGHTQYEQKMSLNV
jgi:hypothetical protein